MPIVETPRLVLLEHLARTGRRGDDLVFGRTASSLPFTSTHIRKRALEAWPVAAVGAFLQRRPLRVEFEPIGLHECRHAVVSMMSAEDGRRVHDYLPAGTGTQSGTQPRLVAAQPQG